MAGELAWALGAALIILTLSSVPYVMGALNSTDTWHFGGLVMDLEDGYSHLAKMQQGAQGGWTYRILFTPEEQPGVVLYVFYFVLGKLAAWSGLSLILVYHLARLACGLFLLVVLYLFLSHFIRGIAARRVAYFLATLSSGWGWLALLLGKEVFLGVGPVDLWLMDGYTFFTIIVFPHSALATGLLLCAFLSALVYLESGGWRSLLWAIAAAVSLCLVHPFSLLLVHILVGGQWALTSIWRRRVVWREALGLTVLAIVPLPLAGYFLWGLRSSPVLLAWQAQSLTLSPHPAHYFLGYGIPAILAVAGAVTVLRRGRPREFFPLIWVGAAAVLLYLPFNLQRRMIEGLQVPVAVLAAWGLVRWALPAFSRSRIFGWLARRPRYHRRGLRRLVVAAILLASIPSSLYLLSSLSLSASCAGPPLFHHRDQVEAAAWLEDHARLDDTILTSYEVGGYIPAQTGRRVFWGHWCETIHLDDKRRDAATIFSSATPDSTRRNLLTKYGVSYIFYGPGERALGGWAPDSSSWLTRMATFGSVTIYRAQAQSKG
jgi:hypothetical protein